MKIHDIVTSAYQDARSQQKDARDQLAHPGWGLCGEDAARIDQETGILFLCNETIQRSFSQVRQVYTNHRDVAVEKYEADIDNAPEFLLLQMLAKYPNIQAIRDTIKVLVS